MNVVKLFDWFLLPHAYLLVFEYVKHDLLSYMRSASNVLEKTQMRRLSYQILRCIEYCHANMFMPRDLKPRNILIDDGMILKIADFGLAREFPASGSVYTHEVQTQWY